MHIPHSSAARARVQFNSNIDQSQAWRSLTEQFQGAVQSLIVNAPVLNPVRVSNARSITSGDLFNFQGHIAYTTDNFVEILSVDPGHSFAIEQGWRPKGVRLNEKSVMEFKLGQEAQGVFVDIRRTDKLKLELSPWYVALGSIESWLKYNSRGFAAANLADLVGPTSRDGIAGQGWDRLPVDRKGAIVTKDRFNGPSLIQR